jgi:hypothetical protein
MCPVDQHVHLLHGMVGGKMRLLVGEPAQQPRPERLAVAFDTPVPMIVTTSRKLWSPGWAEATTSRKL